MCELKDSLKRYSERKDIVAEIMSADILMKLKRATITLLDNYSKSVESNLLEALMCDSPNKFQYVDSVHIDGLGDLSDEARTCVSQIFFGYLSSLSIAFTSTYLCKEDKNVIKVDFSYIVFNGIEEEDEEEEEVTKVKTKSKGTSAK